MPDFTTHFLFGNYAKDDFSHEIQTVIDRNLQAFNWGLQGPDLLFFSKFYRNTGKVARSGSLLHRIDPEFLFSEITEILIQSKLQSYYSCLLSYFYGFLAHYMLDSTVHPYVYYLLYNIDSQITKSRHIQIENEIGCLMLNKLKKCNPGEFHIYDYYDCDGDFIEPISLLYISILSKIICKPINKKEIESSFSICLSLNHLGYLLSNKEFDSKTKQVIYNSALALVKKSDVLSCFLKSDVIIRDTLNLKHHEWYNLNNTETVFTYSVPELFEKARDKTIIAANKFQSILRNNKYEPLGLYETFDNGEPYKKRNRQKKIKSVGPK